MPDTQATPRFGSNAGQPMTRRDGRAKVTGTATFAADNLPEGCLHAVYAHATIAKGRVTNLDVDAAEGLSGVVAVYTPANRPELAGDPDGKPTRFSFAIEVLQSDHVRYAGQPIALVVGETLEAATEGARLLNPHYAAETPEVSLENAEPFKPTEAAFGVAGDTVFGDMEAGHAAATKRVEATVTTAPMYHNAMETHAAVAQWDGDRLHLDQPSQALTMTCQNYAYLFGIPEENVTLSSPYLGGGFGSKAIPPGPLVLCALAARDLQKPVKLSLRREQMFGPVGHRGQTRQHMRIGTDDEGALTALDHEAVAATSSFEIFMESAASASQGLYKVENLRSAHEAVRLDIGTPGPMRAPGEASGSAVLELVIDEMAAEAGLDPLEFRLKNYAEVQPGTNKPFSSKALRECYAEGAKAFGWAGRPMENGTMRDEDGHLVGWGMGTAYFGAPMFSANARATLRADGTAVVETSGADMGQGAWTALAQIAADGLGLPIEQVEFRSGESTLPDASVAGGSGHTATAGGALHAAGRDVVRQLGELASEQEDSPLFGTGNAEYEAEGGRLYVKGDGSRSDGFADILRRAGQDELGGEGTAARPPEDADKWAMGAHGAVFAEVKVDPDLCQMRVTRLVGAFAAGRIINPRLAESQLMGGMVWGIGFALHEEAIHDPRTGAIVNDDLAGYHVPVNADVKDLQVITVHEDDPHVNPLGIKGVGEIGITGTVGAIANAIRHATGHKVRRFPVRIEDLLG